MMCQRIGLPPISTIGLGRIAVSSAKRAPFPPARITTFISMRHRLREGGNEAAARGTVRLLLAHDLGGEVPRQYDDIVRTLVEERRDRPDRNVHAGRKQPYLELVFID